MLSLAGVSEFCDYPSEVLIIPKMTSSLIHYGTSEDIELQVQDMHKKGVKDLHTLDTALLSSIHPRPGVIFTQDSCERCGPTDSYVGEMLDGIGIDRAVALKIKPLTVNDMLSSVLHIGGAIGERHRAEALHMSLLARLENVDRAIKSQLTLSSPLNPPSSTSFPPALSTLLPLLSSLLSSSPSPPTTLPLPLPLLPRVLGLESLYPLVSAGQWLPDMRIRAGGRDALGG